MNLIENPKKPSICIISHKAYGALCGGNSGHIGGVEWQTSFLAKWLAQKGYTVSMLTLDEGGPPIENVAGVRVIKICAPHSGIKGLRFFHPKWTGLISAMRLADADVYYHNCSECVTGQIALWCRLNRKRFVFSSASEMDFNVELPDLESLCERVLYRYGLRHADVRIVQTETQSELLKKNFGLNATIIPMPSLHEMGPNAIESCGTRSNRVLWVGRLCRSKRPDRLLDLAEACPELTFDVVGPVYADEYAKNVHDRAKRVANVNLHGPVARESIGHFYRQADYFCCTSEYEGFPNTFLEAWSHGLPIVSTFDPDGLIRKRRLGIVVRDLSAMTAGIRSLVSSLPTYQEISQNSKRYVLENHRIESVLPRFEKLFLEISRSSHDSASSGFTCAGSDADKREEQGFSEMYDRGN